MPKSTLATFQNGFPFFKRPVKVTDEQKADSDTSANERADENLTDRVTKFNVWFETNYYVIPLRCSTAFSLINFSVEI